MAGVLQLKVLGRLSTLVAGCAACYAAAAGEGKQAGALVLLMFAAIVFTPEGDSKR